MKPIFSFFLFIIAFSSLKAQAPVNDNCSGIIDLGEVPYCSAPAQYTNVNATTSNIDATSNVPSCWNNLGDRDVWFQFSLPANGSITDVSISVWGNIIGNGTLKMPQIAVYRGDCIFNGLAELACVAAPLNVNEAHIDLFGLTPGVPYFIRVNDYSASASPNWGTFKLCVETYVPDVNIGDAPGSSSCTGTLWDSGGPDGDYQSNENHTFVICPTEAHQCIKLNFLEIDTEFDYDFIRVFEGDDISGNLLAALDGMSVNQEIQVSSNCVTIQFDSDGSIQDAGFQMTWICSPEACDAPPPTLPSNATCDHAININGCDNAPQYMPLSPGEGDPNFIQDGINAGCILTPSIDFNFSFFYFQAASDGKFGFAVQSADPNEATDIDFCVWGPINSVDEICDFALTHQPIRSSWDEGEDLTGLADVHPLFGTPVLDNFDCGSPATPGTDPPNGTADDFVRRIDVQTGEIYLIMLDDFGGTIEQSGMAIDFSGTSEGVLGPLSAPITVSGDTSSCNGAPVQLQVTGGTGYAWTPSSGLSCNDCPNPFAAPTQTTTYEVKVIDVCQNVTEEVTVFVGPQINVINDAVICKGQSVTLGVNNPSAGVTYTWAPNDGSLDNASSPNPVATPNQTTVYTVTAVSGVCSVTRVVTVSVVDLELSLNLQDTSICKGNSVVLTATVSPANNPLNWSPITELILLPDGKSAQATPLTSATYIVSTTLPGCTLRDTAFVQVDSLPANMSIIPSDTTICAGEQVLLVSPSYSGAHFPNIQFEWQTIDGQPLPGGDEYFFLAGPDTTTTYRRIGTSGACSVTYEATVNILEVPELTINPPAAALCVGESIPLQVLNSAGLSGPSWSPQVGLSCIACTNPTAAPSNTTTYTFTALAGNNCPTSASVTVAVNQLPQFAFPNDTLCNGESILLNQINDPTVTYNWSSLPPGFSSTEAQPVDMPTQTTTYIVQMENGCTLQQQFTINVVPDGNLTLSDDQQICAGASAQLTASGNFPGTYVWNTGAVGQVISVTPAQSTTYTVTYSYPSPGLQCQSTESVTIDVQGQIAQVQLPVDTLLCPGEGVMLNSIATPGATYLWTAQPPIFASGDPIPPVFYPGETATYTVTATLGNCTVTHSVEVTVFNPQMVVSEDTIVCAGQPVTISADAFLTGDYTWTPGGTEPTFVDTVTGPMHYALEFQYGEGCVYLDTVNVNTAPSFMLDIRVDPDTNAINAGESVMLDAFVPGTNVNDFSFSWTENNTTAVGNTQQVTVTPVTTDSTVMYTVTVVAPNGCAQEESVIFRIILPNVKVPNAFTPNGDGSNDGFGLAIVEGIANVEKIEIYSRWGQKVFESTDPLARWDGTYNGQPAPSDVYAYVIFWRGGDGALHYEKGEITLLR